MSKEQKGKVSYDALKASYYSGKVKPSLNKILVELENDSKNLELTLLACECLVRTKNFNETPRIVSGRSAPLRLIVAPLISLICKLLMWLPEITGFPSSNKVCHMMSRACPCVGAT